MGITLDQVYIKGAESTSFYYNLFGTCADKTLSIEVLTDRFFVYLAVKWLLNWRLSQLIVSVNFKMLYEKNKCRKFYDFAGDFHVKAGELVKQWKSR